jgi:hypothetical protein
VRKLLCFLLVFLFNTSNASDKLDEPYLIRRAYLDALGVIPTIQEIEWYCVYNKNGYSLAIDWILACEKYNWTLPKDYSRIILLSSEYKELSKMKLTKDQVHKNLLYVTGGDVNNITEKSTKEASLKLIKTAIASSNSEGEAIDYMCESLMSRSTNLEEINKLNKILKESTKNEDDMWMDVLQEIMELEDVNSK